MFAWSLIRNNIPLWRKLLLWCVISGSTALARKKKYSLSFLQNISRKKGPRFIKGTVA
jgi:hypothetical protein